VAAKTIIDIQFDAGRFPDKQTQNRIYQAYGNAVELAWRANPSITLKVDPEKDDLCAAAIDLLKQLIEE
jgi:hypothetical protein